jgi:GNAT superfamily N-acetyltransferase
MELSEFIAFHAPALEANPARHNLILGLLERFKEKPDHNFLLWTLGGPGACALKTPGTLRGILLGDLNEAQARELAVTTAGLDYPSVHGEDEAPRWFVAEAERLGLHFDDGEHLRILALSRPPTRPDVPGMARPVAPEDADLLVEWTLAFHRDAGIGDLPPSPEEIADAIGRARHWLWIVDGQPVAMAATGRRMRGCMSIAPVFTQAEFRGRGFGGAITAAVVDQIFAQGYGTACLYAAAANPAPNRCYAKLGFEPVCDSWVFRRLQDGEKTGGVN